MVDYSPRIVNDKSGPFMRILLSPVYFQEIPGAASENLGIKACDRDKSGVYTKVNEHFVEGA